MRVDTCALHIDTCVLKQLRIKLKELVGDWNAQDRILDRLLKNYLNKQGRRSLMVAAGKRNGMLQAKMQGKLTKMLKAKCNEEFIKTILMDRNIIIRLNTEEAFMEKVEENVNEFVQNMRKWIEEVVKEYWKECVTITQERILRPWSACNARAFYNQACMKIVSNFLTTLTASKETQVTNT